MNIVLHEPEIPQNTGSIGRTCMATGSRLHLIRPLGFSLDSRYLKRAGLDYWQHLDLRIHDCWDAFVSANPDADLWFFTTKSSRSYDAVSYSPDSFLVFGKETAGLPDSVLNLFSRRCVRIPLIKDARSLNLSVAVGAACFEALRQNNFAGLSESDPSGRNQNL